MQSPRRVRALTLAELMVSLLVMGILMGGLASAILVASHALPERRGDAGNVADSATVLETMIDDLREATWFAERSAHAVTFTVADRDADGIPERIRYAWSGTSGDPLMRTVGGGTAVTVLENVHDLTLAWTTSGVTEEYPGPVIESSEQLLSTYTGSANLRDIRIDADKWLGQYFAPTLPEGTTEWSVTAVEFEAAVSGPTDGQTAVQIREPAGDNTPSTTVLGETVLLESQLSGSYTWPRVEIEGVNGLTPGNAKCLVLEYLTGTISASVHADAGGGTGASDTSAGEGTWTYRGSASMRYAVYGTYSSPGPPQYVTRTYASALPVKMQVGSAGTPLETTTQLLNTPELLGRFWRAEFDGDPTKLDLDADGNADWAAVSGTFDDTIVDSVWQAKDTIKVQPDCDFNEITYIEYRCRDTEAENPGPGIMVFFDRREGQRSVISTQLELNADNTQTLTLNHMPDGSPLTALTRVSGLDADFVTVRLLLDPTAQTVNLMVNDNQEGTFTYARQADGGGAYLAAFDWNAGAEFDYVRVRVLE